MVSLNTNISAMTSTRLLNVTNRSLEKTTERLSSGLRINRAADDASGLFTAESLTTQVRGNQAAIGNINQAASVVEVADQTLATLGDALQRMRELAVQANNELVTGGARTALNDEYQQLNTVVTQIIANTTYNGTNIFTGFADAVVQVGAEEAAIATIDIDSPGAAPGGDLNSTTAAVTAIGTIDTRLTAVATERGNIGAQISGLEYQKAALETSVVAYSAARSRIRDADIAAEVTNLVSAQIRQQAGASALSAANFSAQFVLQLLQ
jgi:flagellin